MKLLDKNKDIKKILIGTHNKGKIREISYLIKNKIKKITPFDLGIKSPRETGKTFKQNAELKAKYFYNKSKIVSISDDSGLSIKCLDNKPGIYSARWAKKYGSFHKAMKRIIELVHHKNNNRNYEATFFCALTLQLTNKKKISVLGKIDGSISNKIIGTKGFGYDPIFIPKGHKKTFGQMNKRKKILMDHRFIAFKKLKAKINIL